jgi:hypothetical protein
MSSLHSDNKNILTNEAGPIVFRTHKPFARLAVTQTGVLKSWAGDKWDAGVAILESSTITSPGSFQITLDAAGDASIQES